MDFKYSRRAQGELPEPMARKARRASSQVSSRSKYSFI